MGVLAGTLTFFFELVLFLSVAIKVFVYHFD